jgi:hypothetical protein
MISAWESLDLQAFAIEAFSPVDARLGNDVVERMDKIGSALLSRHSIPIILRMTTAFHHATRIPQLQTTLSGGYVESDMIPINLS